MFNIIFLKITNIYRKKKEHTAKRPRLHTYK